jgi:hypothetical protein
MEKNSSALSTTIASWIPSLKLSVLLFCGTGAPGLAAIQNVEIVGQPKVDNARITIRVKVEDENDKPALDLRQEDFTVRIDGDRIVEIGPRDWQNARDSNPPPVWIIVLLDMSGSMSKADASGERKLDGAIEAIRASLKKLRDRSDRNPSGIVPRMAIVPFGEGGIKDCDGYPVNSQTLDKFFAVDSALFENNLDFLANQTPCTSTNLYDSLTKAVYFLGDTNNPDFFPPEESGQAQPRLAIILLSDGFDTPSFDPRSRAPEEEEFERLANLLQRNQEVIVHTLGYGKTPKQLQDEYGLNAPATRANVWGTICRDNQEPRRPPEGSNKICADEFVDIDRLAQIADLTGGIHEFGGKAIEISNRLETFIDAILGEYEISYDHPDPRRGQPHEVQVAVAGAQYPSESKEYRIGVFGRTLPLKGRLIMLSLTLIIFVGAGVIPFWLWAKALKRSI